MPICQDSVVMGSTPATGALICPQAARRLTPLTGGSTQVLSVGRVLNTGPHEIYNFECQEWLRMHLKASKKKTAARAIGARQDLSQDLESGCLKLAIVKFWGVQIFKGGNIILKFQP